MSEYNYTEINDVLSKDEIKEKYGQVSFAYKEVVQDKYCLVAISPEEQQYLKSFLLIDKVNFLGVDNVQDLELFCGVI